MSSSILLIGQPNCGKTTLFNTLTGSLQKTGNYPGVTVERKRGTLLLDDKKLEIIDLPGIYGLEPNSLDEEISVKRLKENSSDTILAVVDTTQLKRSLGFILELKAMAKPIVVALNMADIAASRAIKVDHAALQKKLGVPVIPVVATKKNSLSQLKKTIEFYDQNPSKPQQIKSFDNVKDRLSYVDEIIAAVVSAPTEGDKISRKLDRVLLHPVLGGIIFASILLLVFQSIFTFASVPMDWIEGSIESLGAFVSDVLPVGLFQSFIVDGLIAGIGSVLVFLPQIIMLFFFIYLMESTGYMARAAFLLDRWMSLIGLQGKSFVPLLSSFACAIPGVMAARTIRDERQRLTTILIAPLMACSARLPVYVLLIGAFIPSDKVFGFLTAQGLAMFGLFAFGIVAAVVIAFIFRQTSLKGESSSFVMELPSYKVPDIKLMAVFLWKKSMNFLKKAGGYIFWVSVTLWFLATFPQAPADYEQPDITYSYAGRIGKFIEPVFEPIGFDWRISTGLIPGFAAREVMVSALATVYALDDSEDEDVIQKSLTEKIQSSWSLATGMALLVWYIFSPQCLATFMVAKKETGGWKWPAVMFFYMLALAYIGAFVTYRIFV